MLLTAIEKERYAEEGVKIVKALAHRYLGRIHAKMDIGDLEGAGLYGLTKALNTYNTNNDCKFTTYAFSCINNEIRYYLKREFKIAKITPTSLNETVHKTEDNKVERLNLLRSEAPDVLTDLIHKEDMEIMLECVDSLSPEYKFIVEHRYGLNGKKVLTQEEISRFLGVSQAYTCKTEHKIINMLYIKMRALESAKVA